LKNYLPSAVRNSTRLEDFILSTFMDEWNYLNSLRLHSGQVQQVPFDVIFNDNPAVRSFRTTDDYSWRLCFHNRIKNFDFFADFQVFEIKNDDVT
jgi:hypothetical protein